MYKIVRTAFSLLFLNEKVAIVYKNVRVRVVGEVENFIETHYSRIYTSSYRYNDRLFSLCRHFMHDQLSPLFYAFCI